MQSYLFLVAAALIRYGAPLSLPFKASQIQARSPSNTSIPMDDPPIVNVSLSPNPSSSSTPTPSKLPNPPFRVQISETTTQEGVSETTYLVVNHQMLRQPSNVKPFVLENISIIEQRIDNFSDPNALISGARVFNSDCVTVRFPASKNAENAQPGITNSLATDLLRVGRRVIQAYGPQGWAFASVQRVREGEGVRREIGRFSLMITRPGFTTRVQDFRTN